MWVLCFYPVIFETEVIDLSPVLKMKPVEVPITPLLSQEHQWLPDWEVFRLVTLGCVAQGTSAEASWRSNIRAELSVPWQIHFRSFCLWISPNPFSAYVTDCGDILWARSLKLSQLKENTSCFIFNFTSFWWSSLCCKSTGVSISSCVPWGEAIRGGTS